MRWMYEKKKIICAAVAIVLAVLVTGVLSEERNACRGKDGKYSKADSERSISFSCACK